MPNCEDIQVMIQKRIRDCHHDISNYIEVIQSLKEKDITRESLIINGVSLDGSQG